MVDDAQKELVWYVVDRATSPSTHSNIRVKFGPRWMKDSGFKFRLEGRHGPEFISNEQVKFNPETPKKID